MPTVSSTHHDNGSSCHCVCHHDDNGSRSSPPPCYNCTMIQCTMVKALGKKRQKYILSKIKDRPTEPSAPPEEGLPSAPEALDDVFDDGLLLQVPPQARSPSADSNYGWRNSLYRIPSNNSSRTLTNIPFTSNGAQPTMYQEAGTTTIQVGGPLVSSTTPSNHSFKEIFVRLPSETAVAHSYPALSTIAASNEPTLLFATDEETTQHTIRKTQEVEDFPDDISIDYSMSEESDAEEDLLNIDSNRINQFPLPRISVPKISQKQEPTNTSTFVESNDMEDHVPAKKGLLKTIIRNNSAWGSSEDSSLTSKYKVKGKMGKQNHSNYSFMNIQGIVHQHYATHKENRSPA
ncbi:unnamed protein product, partial [Meganyctiphanes norvegica]